MARRCSPSLAACGLVAARLRRRRRRRDADATTAATGGTGRRRRHRPRRRPPAAPTAPAATERRDHRGRRHRGDRRPARRPGEHRHRHRRRRHTIKIGMLADLSGHLRPARHRRSSRPRRSTGRSSTTTAASPAGRSSSSSQDNGYDVPTHLENYEVASATTRWRSFSQSTGSPHTAAIAEQLVEDDLVAIPLSWYSGWADPDDRRRTSSRRYTSYCVESMNGIEWLANNRDVQTVAHHLVPGRVRPDGAPAPRWRPRRSGSRSSTTAPAR